MAYTRVPMMDPPDRVDVAPDESSTSEAAEATNPMGSLKASRDPAQATVDALSPEQQMALYEESLKDTDWGHQPC